MVLFIIFREPPGAILRWVKPLEPAAILRVALLMRRVAPDLTVRFFVRSYDPFAQVQISPSAMWLPLRPDDTCSMAVSSFNPVTDAGVLKSSNENIKQDTSSRMRGVRGMNRMDIPSD